MNLTEFQLIKQIQNSAPPNGPHVVCGIGDDCAVIQKKKGVYELLTTDCLVEDIHFDLKYFTPFEVGQKAFAVSVSDIAAMGGKPLSALVTLGIPSTFTEGWIDDFYSGLVHDAKEFNVSLVGGDISQSPNHFWVCLFQMGEVLASRCKFRKGAGVGDGIFVTGPLGSSAMGFHLLKKGRAGESTFVRAHKTPPPRIFAGEFLSREPGVTAMIDVSDGLTGDLAHIIEQSNVGAEIYFEQIPKEEGLKECAKKYGASLTDLILAGGEDYQLLFTVKKEIEGKLLKRARKAGFQLFKIGTIVDKDKGLTVLDAEGREMKKVPHGFDHFR